MMTLKEKMTYLDEHALDKESHLSPLEKDIMKINNRLKIPEDLSNTYLNKYLSK
jgi:hypothetical protein